MVVRSLAAAVLVRSSPARYTSRVGRGCASSTSALLISTASGTRSSWLASSISRRCVSAASSSRASIASKLAASATSSVGPRSRPMRRLRSVASMSSATFRTRSIGRTARPAHHQANAAAIGPSARTVQVPYRDVWSIVVIPPAPRSVSTSVATSTPKTSSTGA
jgi:hypothetical protein